MLWSNLGTDQHFTDCFGTFVGYHGGEGEDLLHVGVGGEGPVVLVEDLLGVWEAGVIPHDQDGSVGTLLPDNSLHGLLSRNGFCS